MKKRFILGGVVVALAAAYGGASWYTGKQIEQRMPKFVQDLNQQQDKFTFSYSDFQRGIFTSSLQLNISCTDKNTFCSKDEVLNEPTTIYHGPFPWPQVKHFNLMPALASAVFDINPSKDPAAPALIHSNHVAKYSGTVVSYLQVDKQQNAEFASDAFTLMVTINPQNYTVTLDGTIPSIRFLEDQQTATEIADLQLDNLRIESNQALNDYHLDGQIKAKEIKIKQNVSIKDLVSQTDWRYKDDRFLTQNMTLKFKSFDIMPEHNPLFSMPAVKLQNSEIVANIDNSGEQSKADLGLQLGVILGNQDLGDGKLQVTLKNFAFPEAYQLKVVHNQPMQLDSQIHWQNAKGAIDSQTHIVTKRVSSYAAPLKTSEIKEYHASMSAPYEVIAYLFTQVNAPKAVSVDSQQVEQNKQMIAALVNQAPQELLEYYLVQNEDSATQKMGLYATLDYSDNNPEVVIANGKNLPLSPFVDYVTQQINSINMLVQMIDKRMIEVE